MKAKNILMTLLLVTGAIAAKASGYPAELALVSQPVMVYNHNSITVYYDVENIGDYTYRGDVYIYLDPDYGYYYAKEYVKVRPGRIKRIAVDIPAHSIDLHRTFTIMPYYEVGRELYSFTTFEYFEPVRFYWHGPRTEPWVVIHVEPCIRVYHRPSSYRYYYDGFRPPMPPAGHEPRPMDPMHHTYGYHHSNGGYPANHFNGNTPPPAPNGGEPHGNHFSGDKPEPNNNVAPSATVRPKENAGSMSSGSGNGNAPTANGGSSSSTRPSISSRPSGTTGSSSGSVSRPSSYSSTSGSVSRPSNNGTSRPSSSSNVSGSNTRPATNGSVSRPSSNSSRPSGNSSSSVSGSSNRTGSSSSVRTSSSNSSTRSSGTSSTRSSSSSNSSSRSASTGSSSGRR